jgi:hypothetical protein
MARQVSRRPLPAREQVLLELDAEQIAGAVDSLVHHRLQRGGPVIEGGHRRHDHGAQLGDLYQQPEMTEVQWRFADQQDQPAPLLEGHVCGSQQKVVGVGRGDPRDGLHGARGDDHPLRAEGPRRDGRGDISGPVAGVGERFDRMD